MPRLEAFDEEFAREHESALPEHRPKTRPRMATFLALVVTAGIISALAVAWSGADGPFRFESWIPAVPQSDAGEASNEQIDRLTRLVEALQQEVRDLTEAHQEAARTIATMQAEEQGSRSSSAVLGSWHSDPAALNFGIADPLRPEATPAPRRSLSGRPELRELRKRENGTPPLSLEAPPQ